MTTIDFAKHIIIKAGGALDALSLTTNMLIGRLSKEYRSSYEWEYDVENGDEIVINHLNVWKRQDTHRTETPFKMVLDDKWNELVNLLIKEVMKTNPDIDPKQPNDKPFVPLPDWAVE
jgi:hypothetical protein